MHFMCVVGCWFSELTHNAILGVKDWAYIIHMRAQYFGSTIESQIGKITR